MNKRLTDLKKAKRHADALIKLNRKYPDVVPFIPFYTSVELSQAIKEAKDEQTASGSVHKVNRPAEKTRINKNPRRKHKSVKRTVAR